MKMNDGYNKKWRNNTTVLLIFLVLLASVTMSCKTRKNKQLEKNSTVAADSVLLHFYNKQFVFKTLDARLSVNFTDNDKKQSFNAVLRMQYDSAIWVSVSPFLGIEVARLLITPDSVKILNRLDNTYLLAGRSYLASLLGIDADFAMLQALLIGNDFPHFETDRFSVVKTDASYMLRVENRNRLRSFFASSNLSINQAIAIDTASYRITQNKVNYTSGTYAIETSYSDFKDVSQKAFAHKLNGIISKDKSTWLFDIEFARVNINNELTFPFTIPEKYAPLQ